MIGRTISHYRILERLGSGGMGVVYKAEDMRLKRMVAIKLLPYDMIRDRTAKARFLIEAQAASALDHPNICTVHEIGETDDGQSYIVMTCYEGEVLKRRIERGPLKPQEAIDIAAQVAHGLSRAHARGIVHRDIKPANIMITTEGSAKILDFGLAKLAKAARLTRTGITIGTIAYMSPEQIRGEEADHRMDIWALGIVLYEMLTQRVPFCGEYEAAQMYAIMNDEMDPISSYVPNVSPALMHVLETALKKKSESRYQTALEMYEALRSIDRDRDSQGGGCPDHLPTEGSIREPLGHGNRAGEEELPEAIAGAPSRPSYLRAVAAHLLLGFGLFYVDRRSKRKWLYAFLPSYAIVVLAFGWSFEVQLFRGTFGLYSFLLAAVLYELSFLDIAITCRMRRKTAELHGPRGPQ